MKKCNLDRDINECPYYDKEKEICINENTCSFQVSDEEIVEKYERKERWYEKYYK